MRRSWTGRGSGRRTRTWNPTWKLKELVLRLTWNLRRALLSHPDTGPQGRRRCSRFPPNRLPYRGTETWSPAGDQLHTARRPPETTVLELSSSWLQLACNRDAARPKEKPRSNSRQGKKSGDLRPFLGNRLKLP